MKQVPILIMLFFLTTLSSCQAIGDIFKTGVWTGIIIVVVIIVLIIMLISRGSKK